MTETVEMIERTAIRPSPFNPRAVLPNIGELQQNIAANGIFQPLIVRSLPDTDDVEIVDGARRYEASNGIHSELPCIVRNMNEEEARQFQLISALQREDLTPYDEAVAIKALMQERKEPSEIAAILGKPEKYVRRRVILAELIEPVATKLSKGEIDLDMAFRIARLSKMEQETLVKESKRWSKKWEEWQVNMYLTNLYHELSRAPWHLDDAALVPAAGACTTCPKQSGAQSALFEDIKSKTVCLDSLCYESKVTALEVLAKKEHPDLVRITENYNAHTKDKSLYTRENFKEISGKERCESTKTGFYIDGAKRGSLKTICVDPKCKVHKTDQGFRINRPEKTPKEIADRKAELREQRINQKLGARIFTELYNVPGDGFLLNKRVAEALWSGLWHEHKKRICIALGEEPGETTYGGKDYSTPIGKRIEKADEKELKKLLMAMCAAPLLDPHTVKSAIEDFKLNKFLVDKMRKEVIAELDTKKGKTDGKGKKDIHPGANGQGGGKGKDKPRRAKPRGATKKEKKEARRPKSKVDEATA